MAIAKKGFSTAAVRDKIYPIVAEAMKKHFKEWKKCMSSFVQKRSASLFDTIPCDRIFYNMNDVEELFSALHINKAQIESGLAQTYYWNIDPFKPSSAKDALTIVALCIIRYFLLEQPKNTKDLSLAMVYNSFSGKYYPSIHYAFFKVVTPAKYRHVMEYVVNHKLSLKFELKAQGSVIAAVKKINDTWIETYTKLMQSFDDEDVTYVIQQLHNRIKSFMKNIANVYYEAYANKDYISYDSDSIPEEESGGQYHLTNNDSFKLQKYTENAMTRITTTQVDYKICKMSADANVKTEEVKSIFEAIMNDKKTLDLLREFITNMIASYLMQETVTNKDVVSANFFKYAVSFKPNTKDPLIIRMKDIVEKLLDDYSVAYRKRKHRGATKNSYHRAFNTYFALIIMASNK